MRVFPSWLPLLLLACGTLVPVPASANGMAEAQALLKRGDPARALQKIEAHVASRPEDAQGRFLQGVILTSLKRNDEATAVFRQLTIEFPQFPEPYNNLAVLQAAAGNYDAARQALEAAVRANPKYATAYENLGDIYAQLARRAYDKAATLDSSTELQGKLKLAQELAGGLPRSASTTSTPSTGSL